MKVSGFTIIRNAIKYDYPIKEAILSVLPLCDEFIVAVGNSEDNTRDLVANICYDKIKIIDTIWNDTKREGGEVLANETNKALNEISADTDWAIYIQGDEVLHENYIDNVYKTMKKYQKNIDVQGLLFNYIHFYGNYNYIGNSRRWYRREVRAIRPNIGIKSYKDAQGFRLNDKKLFVKDVDAFIYHYGWVKSPQDTLLKNKYFQTLWHNDKYVADWLADNTINLDEYDYSNIDSLELFTDEHPKVMEERIKSKNWNINFDLSKNKLNFRNRLLYLFEKYTGYRLFEYKNYKKI